MVCVTVYIRQYSENNTLKTDEFCCVSIYTTRKRIKTMLGSFSLTRAQKGSVLAVTWRSHVTFPRPISAGGCVTVPWLDAIWRKSGKVSERTEPGSTWGFNKCQLLLPTSVTTSGST